MLNTCNDLQGIKLQNLLYLNLWLRLKINTKAVAKSKKQQYKAFNSHSS